MATFNKVFKKIAENTGSRYVDCGGGTRSGKTFAILQYLFFLTMQKQPLLISVVSETLPHLKRGAIRDYKTILEGDNLWDDRCWNKSENTYRFSNGSIIEFFSADQPSKVHGPARDVLFINEAVNVDYETARQLFIRTRKKIFLDYNPVHSFWVHEHIQPRDNCYSITSTYRDNDYLTKEQIEEIESNRGSESWWRVYGEGLVGQLEGTIYDFEQIDELPNGDGLKEVYGLDFGFTNDPTALVRVLADTGRKILYVKEEIYKTRLLNSDIVELMKRAEVAKVCPIYADCAEPKSIKEIYNAGFNVKPCQKDAPVRSEKMQFQINFVKGWKLFVTKDSVNLIKELRNYTWDKDKDGNSLNVPISKWDHALDALRYAVYTHFAGNERKGDYTLFYKR